MFLLRLTTLPVVRSLHLLTRYNTYVITTHYCLLPIAAFPILRFTSRAIGAGRLAASWVRRCTFDVIFSHRCSLAAALLLLLCFLGFNVEVYLVFACHVCGVKLACSFPRHPSVLLYDV